MNSAEDMRAKAAATARVRDGGADHALAVVRTIAALMGDNELANTVENALVRIGQKRTLAFCGNADAPDPSADDPSNEHQAEPDAGDFESACDVLVDVGAILEVWARGVPMRAALQKLVQWSLTETRSHIAVVSTTN